MVTKQNGLMSGEHKRLRPSSCSAVLLIFSHRIIAFLLTLGGWFSLSNIGQVKWSMKYLYKRPGGFLKKSASLTLTQSLKL